MAGCIGQHAGNVENDVYLVGLVSRTPPSILPDLAAQFKPAAKGSTTSGTSRLPPATPATGSAAKGNAATPRYTPLTMQKRPSMTSKATAAVSRQLQRQLP
jgi:hypothetical protein